MYITPTVTECSNGIAALAVDQPGLAVGRQAGHLERGLDLALVGAVEHRRREVHAGAQLAGEPTDVVLLQLVDEGLHVVRREQLLQLLLEDVAAPVGLQVRVDLPAQLLGRPPEVDLQDLADVHARRHAQRVEDDVDRGAVLEVRHVLLGQEPRDDALVAVTAGHLVADRQLPLDGQVDLDQLDDAGRQLVALGQLGDLLGVLSLDRVDVLLAHPGQLLDLLLGLAVALDHLDLVPVLVGTSASISTASFSPLGRSAPCPCRRPGATRWSCRPGAPSSSSSRPRR
jgi:hypothetical protein